MKKGLTAFYAFFFFQLQNAVQRTIAASWLMSANDQEKNSLLASGWSGKITTWAAQINQFSISLSSSMCAKDEWKKMLPCSGRTFTGVTMVMSEDSDWSQSPAVTNSLQREAKERWRGIWVWNGIEKQLRSEGGRSYQHLPWRPIGRRSRARWCKQEVEKRAWTQGRYNTMTTPIKLHSALKGPSRG